MSKIIKTKLPKDDDCGCGRQVKKSERKSIVYKKTKRKNPK